MTRKTMPPEERFWLNIEEGDFGCWNYMKGWDTNGYGRLSLGSRTDNTRRSEYAHRFSYLMLVGPIEAEALDHLCQNTHCVNPDHLEPVTKQENINRSPLSAQVINRAKLKCPEGHPYDRKGSKGERRCSVCSTTYRKQWRADRRSLGLPYV